MNFDSERKAVEKKTACEIRMINWLSKHALDEKSRWNAYKAKYLKISAALLSFSEFFRVVSAQKHKQYGYLLLSRRFWSCIGATGVDPNTEDRQPLLLVRLG